MKALRTKVVLSAFVLLFALVASIGSTFAWFTVSRTVEVQAMEFKLSTEDSILIKVAAPDALPAQATDAAQLNSANYFTTITNTMIINAGYTAFTSWSMKPVTAVQPGYAAVNPKLLSSMAIVGNSTRTLTPTEDLDDINKTSGRYIELKFWMISSGTANALIVVEDLYIDVTSLNAVAVRDEVINAVRLGVWANNEDAKVFGRSIDYRFTFLPSLPGYFAGTEDETNYNSIPLASRSVLENAMGRHHSTVADIRTPAASVAGSTTLKAETTQVFELVKDTPKLVTVRIFVEGWALATTNNIVDAAFKINFNFRDKNSIA
jgi:hypothetical protein